ncbi:hypothetical protein [Streptomyces cavernicola]|uniref:VCBS repeat-containing protein n=1 Tax=Streptomyces cavernicola TaxID=3043613 RepID=A0ABT6S7M2_9ACTN|nr:hypothetical protein [Streptomyces sp. B-S-A6]MDI3404102.1 hypothetical protein [Streptomyces sp. B-S-A6]
MAISQRTGSFTAFSAFLAILLMTGACDAPAPGPRVEPSAGGSEDPGRGPSSPSPTAASPDAPQVVGPAPRDLHDVDWAEVPVPGDFCGVPGLVRWNADGQAVATSRTWGTVRLILGREVQYGDTDGDQHDEAVVYVGCDDNGATQNTQLVASYVVFDRVGDNLAAIGTITPQQKSASYTTALVRADFEPGRIIVHEKWYRPNDSHCCPSGDATTFWSREGNHLTPGAPRITS